MLVDFRSDTVTQPTDEMREFMLKAPVGDDVFCEDPTVNELERFAADYFGKEAALYCTSGTQTNQIAINVHCRPGDEVICSEEAHIYYYEGGGVARNSGTSVALLPGDRGRISVEMIEKHINNPTDVHRPLTSLVEIEDTMNRGGGAIYNFNEIKAIRELCQKHHLPFHLDGARVFNALVETGISPKEYGEQFDSISICLSKGLGAPVGSVLLGTKAFINKARRVRKVFGGGMRQAGIIAAGGLFALQNNINRLKEDHQQARKLGNGLQQLDWVEKVWPVETNIVIAQLADHVDVNEVVEKAKGERVLFLPVGGKNVRLVTHLDTSPEHIEYALSVLQQLKIS